MRFELLDPRGNPSTEWEVYSVGRGAIMDAATPAETAQGYPHGSMREVFDSIEAQGKSLWECVEEHEGLGIWK